MGQVYLAQDTLLDRLVAVKFIAARVLDEDERRERFRVEARAIARLHHPNVVMVHRIGEVESQPYLVSEYVRGERLDELPKPIPGPRLLTIAIDLARGLAAAHRHGVLHRDIKPANVMVAADGVTKLLDFGLAKLIEAAVVDPHQPQPAAVDDRPPGVADAPSLGNESTLALPSSPSSAAIIGTPLYMAPEIWRQEPATRLSDVYSLGVLLYELGAGRLPHAGKSLQDLCTAVTTTPLPPLGDLANNIDAGFSAVVDRCVAIEPRRRFESGDAVREALEALAAPGRADQVTLAAPYRGLRPFEAEHRAVFFGRDGDVRAVIDRLRTDSFVLVAGDSGVGKSSLIAAGVLPALAEGALAQDARFTSVRLVPGRHPLAALAAALAPACSLEEAELHRRLMAPPADLARLLRRRAQPIVVVFDQLEELVTLADASEAAATAELLCELAGCGARNVRLIGTVRADFLARVAALSRLREELPRALYLLAPLLPTGLRDAVLGPARALGWSFESEDTVDAMVDAAIEPGALPLLAFALAELWEARDPQRRVIPAGALEAIGGVAGALARHADAVVAGLLPADRVIARQVLSLLVTADGTRGRRSDRELATGSTGAGPERTRDVVEALVRGRVLVAGPAEQGEEATYELAHETLVGAWGTLHGWLNNQAEARAIRARVEKAATEWQRLGRPREALWHQRQLAEVRVADPASLGPRERAFLQRSRAAVRLRRAAIILAILALPLTAAAAYGGNQWAARRARDREIAQWISDADAILKRAHERNQELDALRRSGVAMFDAGRKDEGELVWKRVVSAAQELEGDYERAQQTLEQAVLLDGSRIDVRRRIAEAIYDTACIAEKDHRLLRRDELLGRLAVYDKDGALARRWKTPAHLDINATPSTTSISLQRYDDADGRRRLSSTIAKATGTLRGLSLEPGSYLITLYSSGRVVVRYPVLLERAERYEVAIPIPAVVPEGFVYVAPGQSLVGSADPEMVRLSLFSTTPPLHSMATGAYFIQRTEVTLRQWIEFLRSLRPDERERRRPQGGGPYGTIDVAMLGDGRWHFALQRTGTKPTEAYRATEGERVHYRDRADNADQDWIDFPVTGVSWSDANAYAAWLAASGRVPGARLCDEYEWERAARGADDRAYPHGDRLDPGDANFDLTYERKRWAFGLDTVGLHPASDSPFGVADLVGNAWEWVRSTADPKKAQYSGGSFYGDAVSARSYNRRLVDGETRSVVVGVRVCADVPTS